ncbi:MAG: helix-turn-helix transcriptional regulator, partial [Bacilli bacterium]|nr:helix-turn-helix transcriptional regulator [Bacilli bacterium]
GLNRAEDNASFKFYQKDQTKGQLGNIVLKGCFAIGSDTYDSSPDDYNYVATKEQALLDGVIDEDSIINVSNGLYPIKGSKADIKVSSDVYHNWSEVLLNYSGDRYIGVSNPSRNENKSPVTLILILSISGGALIVILVVLVIVFARKSKKRNIIQDTQVEEKDMRPEYVSTLSEREKKVVELLIVGKKRKDIANELSFSENTIKRDLTVIYSKLHVTDKFELILKYKDLF